jgi:RNA polymerase sigma factor (sigma-70 family)
MTAFERFKRDPRNMEAFDEWYREAYPPLFLFAFRITRGNRPLAEDLCHDAILAFVTRGHMKKAKNSELALGYVRQSIAHAHVDVIRAKTRESANPLVLESVTDDPGETLVAAQNVYSQLIGRLGPDDHEILGMMFAGESLSRIAAALNISYTNAGVRVHRIRNIINELTGAG